MLVEMISCEMSTNEATITNEVKYGLFHRYRCVDNPDADRVLTRQWWNGFVAGAIASEIVIISLFIGAEYYIKRRKN